MWNLLWNQRTRICKLGGKDALIMPYVHPCTEEDWNQSNVKNAAIEAVKEMVDKKYKHNDLKRQHVGLYKKEGKIKAVLFDLADVGHITNPEEANEAIKNMLNDLSKSQNVLPKLI